MFSMDQKIFSDLKFLILFFRLEKFSAAPKVSYYFFNLKNLLRHQICYTSSPTSDFWYYFLDWKIFPKTRFFILFFWFGKSSPTPNFLYYFYDLKIFFWNLFFIRTTVLTWKIFSDRKFQNTIFPTWKISSEPNFGKLLILFLGLRKFYRTSNFWCYFFDLKNFP